MRAMIAATIAGLAIAAAAFTAGHYTAASGPHCPTEDSCAVSYHGGAWHITPVIP